MLVIQEHLQEVVKQSVFEMLIVSLIGCYGTLFEMLRRPNREFYREFFKNRGFCPPRDCD